MKSEHLHKRIAGAWKGLGILLLLTGAYTANAASVRAIPPSARQGMVERVAVVMEKIDGMDDAALDSLCRHYGFSYSNGLCQNAKGGIPVDKLVDVAACHYPDLGEVLSKRRNEMAKLEKMCGKKGSKLKSTVSAYNSSEAKLQELEGLSDSRQKRCRTTLEKAATGLAAVDRSLRKVEEMDGKIAQALAKIQQGGGRTDVSIVKAKSGYRLSANISTTVSPDAIIREQQYVWDTCGKEEEYDEGIDL